MKKKRKASTKKRVFSMMRLWPKRPVKYAVLIIPEPPYVIDLEYLSGVLDLDDHLLDRWKKYD